MHPYNKYEFSAHKLCTIHKNGNRNFGIALTKLSMQTSIFSTYESDPMHYCVLFLFFSKVVNIPP